MKHSRFNDALLTANLGLKLNPRNPRFELMQAHTMVGLKRLDESDVLLNQIAQSSAGRVRRYAQRINKLKHAILTIRKNLKANDLPSV